MVVERPNKSAVLDEDEEPDIPDVDDFDPPKDDGGDEDEDEGDDDGGDGESSRERWVTVATFWNSPQAHIARLRLESEEIDAILVDEFLVATDWLYANAVGGIKLRVPEGQVAQASAILNDRPPQLARLAEDDVPVSRHAAAEPGDLCCPDCGSLNVHRPIFIWRNLWALVAILMLTGTPLLILLPFLLTGYMVWFRPHQCRPCGNVWFAAPSHRGFEVQNPHDREDRA